MVKEVKTDNKMQNKARYFERKLNKDHSSKKK